MLSIIRAAVLMGLAFAAAPSAHAQFFFNDVFAGPSQRPNSASRAATPRAKGKAVQPARQSSWWDDEDEDERPQRAAPRSAPTNAAAQRPWQATWDGGGRPAISPAAPPVVSYSGPGAAGSVIIDTSGRALYYVLGGGRAYRYPIAVGKEGFTWTGTQRVSRVQAWPDWRPPAEMRQRQPHLPLLMTGGVHNPLGAKAIYLGSTLYRIHGTNDARSIGSASSSGCFRMTNANVMHLASLVRIGTTVTVLRGLPGSARRNIATAAPSAGRT